MEVEDQNIQTLLSNSSTSLQIVDGSSSIAHCKAEQAWILDDRSPFVFCSNSRGPIYFGSQTDGSMWVQSKQIARFGAWVIVHHSSSPQADDNSIGQPSDVH